MRRVLAAIDAFDVWLDKRRLCWKVTICAGIACVAATLMLAVGEVVVNGEVPARVGAYMSVVTPAVLVTAFIAGLAAEWIEKRRGDGGMRRWVLAAAAILILLAGIAAAEPQPVDSDWQRSDGTPAEIETLADAPPETAEEAEGEAGTAWVLYVAVAACGLYALTAAVLWVRRTRRAGR